MQEADGNNRITKEYRLVHPFDGFTYAQAGMIKGLLLPGVKVRWLGIDAKGLPVVQFKDQRRLTEPFAVPRRPRPSASVPPTLPIHDLTEEDLEVIDEGSHFLICQLQRTPIE